MSLCILHGVRWVWGPTRGVTWSVGEQYFDSKLHNTNILWVFDLVSTDFSPFLGARQVGLAENFSLPHPSVIRFPFWFFRAAFRETRAQFGDFAGRLYSAVFSSRNNRSDLLHSAPVSLGLSVFKYVDISYFCGPV